MAKQASGNPSEVLKAFLEQYNLTPAKVAADIKLSQSSIRQLINNKMKISIPIALRLEKYFGNTVQWWIELQNKYDISSSAKDQELSGVLKGISKAKKVEAPAKKTAKADPKKAKAGKPGRPAKAGAAKKAKAEAPAKRGRKKAADSGAAKPAAKPGRKPRAKKAAE